jgi:hypothetical protein
VTSLDVHRTTSLCHDHTSIVNPSDR